MSFLKHLAGIVFLLPRIGNALLDAGEKIQGLESRQLESNGVPSMDNFLNRAYHSGTENPHIAI